MASRRGFTLIELLVFLAMAAGFAFGLAVGARHGKLAALACAGVGLGAVPFALLLLGAALDLAARRRPPRPRCFAGRCDYDAYLWIDVKHAGATGWRCACGDLYLEHGDRFLRVIKDDIALAYMVKDAKGRWRPEPRRAA